MIERFSWLLVSDLHLRVTSDLWSQNVALRELVRDVEGKRDRRPRFIVVSGDLAFSGAEAEYQLVEQFLDQLRGAVGLDRSQVYMVPGNHDIDRRVQTTCFAGAREILHSASAVEEFLGKADERETLLKRLKGYFGFEDRYTAGQTRRSTPDRLGYVAPIDIDGFPLTIAALNSAWLCGNNEDKSNIVIGERPVIDVIELLRDDPGRMVLGVYHHPPDWLREFDQLAVEERFITQCDIVHRGHLHEPGVRLMAMRPGQNCVAVAAGAGHAGRHFVNSYSFVTVDLAKGNCEVEAFGYEASRGKFRSVETQTYPLRLRGSLPGGAGDLAGAIESTVPDARHYPHFIAALLSGMTSDVPAQTADGVVFVSCDVLAAVAEASFAEVSHRFLEVKNLLLAFPDGVPLAERIVSAKERIEAYCRALRSVAERKPEFGTELGRRDGMYRSLLGAKVEPGRVHTIALLADLQGDGDWLTLEVTSRRHVTSTDPELSTASQRSLAIGLSQQGDSEKLKEACQVAARLARSAEGQASDFILAATLFHNDRQDLVAVALLKEMAAKKPGSVGAARDIGLRLTTATGDIELRRLLGLDTLGGGGR